MGLEAVPNVSYMLASIIHYNRLYDVCTIFLSKVCEKLLVKKQKIALLR